MARYLPDIVDVRSFIVLILVVWRNKNKIKVCLIIFPFDVSRVQDHVSPWRHPALITLALLTSFFARDSVMRYTNTSLADVTRHVSPVTKLSRTVFCPGPRLSQHWLRGPDTRETRARDNPRAPTPGHPGSLCCCKFYSRGNIKIFLKLSLMQILQLVAAVFV